MWDEVWDQGTALCRLTCILQCLDVLRSGGLLRHHLHEPGPGILVQLEHWGERQGGAAGHPVLSIPSGRPSTAPYLAAPAAGSWRRVRGPLSTIPRPPVGLTARCTHIPGQPTGTGTQPFRGNGRYRA